MMDNTFLKINGRSFLKKITVSNSAKIYGFLYYVREITDDYDFTKESIENKLIDDSAYVKTLFQKKTEDDYPTDLLDKKILEAIQNEYDKSSVESSVIAFQNDIDHLKTVCSKLNKVNAIIEFQFHSANTYDVFEQPNAARLLPVSFFSQNIVTDKDIQLKFVAYYVASETEAINEKLPSTIFI